MSSWATNLAAVTLFVDDLGQAKEFYGRVFELSPMFEDADSAAFRLGSTIINVLVTSAAPELIEPALVASAGAGARMQLTISVDDVDAVCARLRERGVELLNGPQDRPWGVRTAAFQDPAGHVWEIAK